MATKLERISQLSRENPDMVFTSIGHLIDKELLRQCHKDMDGKKAVGIDGVTKEEYGANLENNLDSLVICLLSAKFTLDKRSLHKRGGGTMSTLVAYFSAEAGKTRKIAEAFSRKMDTTLFEIIPEKPYTSADLKWTNPLARCNREKIGRKDVPVRDRVEGWDSYDTVFLGFPIWYYGAPNVVNTFCKGYDWSGKRIYLFATSGSSGIGKTAEKLGPFVKGGRIIDAKRVTGIDDLAGWLK